METIESNSYWETQIKQHLKKRKLSNVSIRYIPAESRKREDILAYIHAIYKGNPWDVVVVDGLEESYLSRVACIKEAVPCIKSNGILVLDDAWREEYSVVPQILKGWKRLCFQSLGPARPGVTQTDVYVRQ